MFGELKDAIRKELDGIREAGLYKDERVIAGPQGADIRVTGGQEVINFCANNYLGLSSHPAVLKAAHETLDKWGYGMSSVRFICGTQQIHKELERKVSEFLGTDDTILYAACFDANGGIFEPFLGKEAAVISDALNHASIIDGIRLTKCRRLRYEHNDMADLEAKLKEAAGAAPRMIVTDGVFSMNGDMADLPGICDLAEKHDAMVVVDDSHATGFIGKTGRGTIEHFGVMGRVDLITTTFGKALGGASGGCVSGRSEIVELCRQRARPYLFSNAIPPVVVAAANKVMDLLSASTERRDKLEENTRYWRELLEGKFDVKPGESPIVPIMLYNAQLAQDMARELYDEGIYVTGFFFPVVPKGQARIRTQISAAHDRHHLDKAFEAFIVQPREAYHVRGHTVA